VLEVGNALCFSKAGIAVWVEFCWVVEYTIGATKMIIAYKEKLLKSI
jgi:hypothetical protein